MYNTTTNNNDNDSIIISSSISSIIISSSSSSISIIMFNINVIIDYSRVLLGFDLAASGLDAPRRARSNTDNSNSLIR